MFFCPRIYISFFFSRCQSSKYLMPPPGRWCWLTQKCLVWLFHFLSLMPSSSYSPPPPPAMLSAVASIRTVFVVVVVVVVVLKSSCLYWFSFDRFLSPSSFTSRYFCLFFVVTLFLSLFFFFSPYVHNSCCWCCCCFTSSSFFSFCEPLHFFFSLRRTFHYFTLK